MFIFDSLKRVKNILFGDVTNFIRTKKSLSMSQKKRDNVI